MTVEPAHVGNAYYLKCRIVEWIDADTLEVHPIPLPAGTNLRVRLKDTYRIEIFVKGGVEALAQAKLELGDVRGYVHMTNAKHEFDHGRVVARLDRA